MCDGDRDGRLADATSPDDGDEARSGQFSRQLENVVLPADHSVERWSTFATD
jgi:hypothetical protein